MASCFETEYFGKSDVASHFARCETCRRLVLLSSYTTTRFAKFFNVPFLPLGKFRILVECPKCGQRGVTTRRKYTKDRKHNLTLMMDGFASEPDNPDTCSNALQTLMIYDEKEWFQNVQKSYGLRFDTHMQIQYVIAQGLCRFGNYSQAITYCRKAIVLGAGAQAEELMEFCHTLQEATEGQINQDHTEIVPESAYKAYLPITTLAASLVLLLSMQGISAMRNHHAWLINGSLQEYSFVLDGETYTLASGNRKQIKLRLGQHELQIDQNPAVSFSYSIPLLKQLLGKHLLVINPDAMALLSIEGAQGTIYSHGKQVHSIPGVIHPLFSFQTVEDASDKLDRIGLYRPDTHMAMIERLSELELTAAAGEYARHALAMNPTTAEAPELLDVAIQDKSDTDILAFLKTGTAISPPLLPWHIHYQDHVMGNHPDHELVREYTVLCKNHPEDAEWYYLLGRVMRDPADARKFFQYAERGRGMEGAGFQAVANSLFIHGDFEEALASSLQALGKSPDNAAFKNLHEQILLALRRYDALLAMTDQEDPASASKTVLYLTCTGYHREAEAAIARFSSEQASNGSMLNAIRFHAVGNMDDYLACLAETGKSHAELERLYHLDRIEDADLLLSANENHPWWEHLVMYCAAMRNQENEIAKTHLAKAIAEIGIDTPGRKQAANILAANAPPNMEEIRQLDLSAREKALLCSVLTYRFPEQHDALHRLSLMYNFNPGYPQHLLKKRIPSPHHGGPTVAP